jgi:FixJ family two-component response regulator
MEEAGMNDALVLVVDDDPSVRIGLARILRSAGYAVELFDGARQLLARLSGVHAPCCVLSDVRMPGMDGLALQEALRSLPTTPALVFLTAYPDVRTTVRAIQRGAHDLLEKPVPADVLLVAVEEAMERAREGARRRHQADGLHERYRSLTPRERQVFALVTSGLLNKQVGFELGTSEKTVKVQRARVMEKMGAGSLADLVRMADLVGIGPEGGPVAAWDPAHLPAPAVANVRW